VTAVVVVTAGPEAGAPCGACRQVLAEFADDPIVRMLAVDEENAILARRDSSVDALLPGRFRGEQVFAATKA